MLQLSDLSTQNWQTLCHNADFSEREYRITCLPRHKHAHRHPATACQKNDMPCFELRWVYLSPAVTHYQEGVQLCKVLHIMLKAKTTFILSRPFDIKNRIFCYSPELYLDQMPTDTHQQSGNISRGSRLNVFASALLRAVMRSDAVERMLMQTQCFLLQLFVASVIDVSECLLFSSYKIHPHRRNDITATPTVNWLAEVHVTCGTKHKTCNMSPR